MVLLATFGCPWRQETSVNFEMKKGVVHWAGGQNSFDGTEGYNPAVVVAGKSRTKEKQTSFSKKKVLLNCGLDRALSRSAFNHRALLPSGSISIQIDKCRKKSELFKMPRATQRTTRALRKKKKVLSRCR